MAKSQVVIQLCIVINKMCEGQNRANEIRFKEAGACEGEQRFFWCKQTIETEYQ